MCGGMCFGEGLSQSCVTGMGFGEGTLRSRVVEWILVRGPQNHVWVTQSLNQSKALTDLCPQVVRKFHNNLYLMPKNNNYQIENVSNVEEIEVQIGKYKGTRVISKKGSIVVHEIKPHSRKWLIILCCVNSTNQELLRYSTFKRENAMQNYLVECEEEAIISMQGKAQLTNQLFEAWQDQFEAPTLKYLSPIQCHLLIVDGHESHTKLEVAKNTLKCVIDIVTLFSHPSHTWKLLDVAMFNLLKSRF